MKKKVSLGFPCAVGLLSYLGFTFSGLTGLALNLCAMAIVIVFGIYLQIR